MWLVADATDRLLGRLKDVGQYIKSSGEYQHHGYLRNMKIRASNNRVVIDGSLPKFCFGHNFKQLGLLETQRALEDLSDHLGLSVKLARVSRIDVAANFVMDSPVWLYTGMLGQAPYLRREPYRNGNVYYKNRRRWMLFYDKTKEYADKRCGDLVPSAFNGKNVLRYQLRYIKALAKQFKTEIRACDLHNKSLYYGLVDRWYGSYQSVQKLPETDSREFRMKNLQDFKNYAFVLTMYWQKPQDRYEKARETSRRSRSYRKRNLALKQKELARHEFDEFNRLSDARMRKLTGRAQWQ